MNVFLDIVRDVFSRGSNQMVGRLHGPLNLRLIITPTLVTLLAIRDGWKEGRAGQLPFLWRLVTKSGERKAVLQSGWKELKRVIILAFVLDMGYQFYVFRAYFVFQTILLVLVMAIIPYTVIRGVTTRAVTLFLLNRQRSRERAGQ
jgi:hypothetical protein